jgi:phosphate-selective porin OprO/OprP
MKNFNVVLLWIFFIFSTNVFAQTQTENKFIKTIKLNGRIQADYEFLKRDKQGADVNAFEFRRVQLAVSGKISPKIKYKLETNFSHAKIGFRDAYIKFLLGKYGNFAIGSALEPTGINTLTSSKYITFVERSMLTSLKNFNWGAGLHYENFNLFNTRMGFQFSLTNNGVNGEGFKDPHLEKGNNYIGRVFGVPLLNKDAHQVIHLGINFADRPAKDLSFRPENHMGDKYKYVFDGATERQELGFEFATTYGAVSLQSEYKIQNLVNDLNKDYKMTSFYAFAGYFITGEHRPYKHGAFGRVKPVKDIDNDGLGAFELIVRYSQMKATDDVLQINTGMPQQINNITIGLNWYLTSHARIMYNYVITDDNNNVMGNLSGHLFRVAIDF